MKVHAIGLASVDATLEENKALAKEYGVKGYPSLKVYNQNTGTGGLTDYKGERNEQSMVQNMLDEGKPTITEIVDINEITGEKPSFVYIGRLTPSINTYAKSNKS